jgi:hypothetical protein
MQLGIWRDAQGPVVGPKRLRPTVDRMTDSPLAMRVELPDEPYTLGRLATALGLLGANIIDIDIDIDIDVHELDGANVVARS